MSPDRKGSGAEGLVLQQASSLISKRFATLFGLDSLAIEPLSESGNLSSARIRVGKQISNDLRVNYSYDPTDAEEDRLELEWQVTRGFVIILTQSERDRYTFDARLEHRF